jgi:peptidoglycan/LPS O-acetylase OafA/YrhL
MITVADRLGGRDNNFNLVRFLAASLVIYEHCFPLVLGVDAQGNRRFDGEWLHETSGGYLSCGGLGVAIFFVISGFLVARSLDQSASLGRFVQARVLRIYPGLIVNVALAALVLGPALTTLPLARYFSDGGLYGFLLRNMSMVTMPPASYLPGVFEHNPYPGLVNGPLWTLPWELCMYVSLAVLGLAGLLRLRRLLSAAILALMALYFVCLLFLHELNPSFWVFSTIHFSASFYMGTLVYLQRRRLPCNALTLWGSAAALALVVALIRQHPRLIAVVPPLVGCLALSFALVPKGPLLAFNRLGDYSYGLYIYAFPIQQALATLMLAGTPMQMLGLCFPLSLLAAMLSWHLVEKRALALKRPAVAAEPAQNLQATV